MDTSLKNINDENILDNIFNEAMDLIEKGNIEQGLEKLRNLSRQKYGKAQYKLGYYYLNGEYVKKDYAYALYYLTQSDSKGIAEATELLAYCFENGIGVARSPKRAKMLRCK